MNAVNRLVIETRLPLPVEPVSQTLPAMTTNIRAASGAATYSSNISDAAQVDGDMWQLYGQTNRH